MVFLVQQVLSTAPIDPHPPSVPPPAAGASEPIVIDENAFFATVVDKSKETIVVSGIEPQQTNSANEWTLERNPVVDFVAYWTSKRPKVAPDDGAALNAK
jgi:hypothetical protein